MPLNKWYQNWGVLLFVFIWLRLYFLGNIRLNKDITYTICLYFFTDWACRHSAELRELFFPRPNFFFIKLCGDCKRQRHKNYCWALLSYFCLLCTLNDQVLAEGNVCRTSFAALSATCAMTMWQRGGKQVGRLSDDFQLWTSTAWNSKNSNLSTLAFLELEARSFRRVLTLYTADETNLFILSCTLDGFDGTGHDFIVTYGLSVSSLLTLISIPCNYYKQSVVTEQWCFNKNVLFHSTCFSDVVIDKCRSCFHFCRVP